MHVSSQWGRVIALSISTFVCVRICACLFVDTKIKTLSEVSEMYMSQKWKNYITIKSDL